MYQSHLGQQLLQIDASALGLSLVDAKHHEQEQMLTLATAASTETKQLIQQVLEVSSGKRKLESVDQVQSIQKKIATQAADAHKAGRMTQKQVETLVEASRGHVSTGFGTCHEDEALDIYEKRVGCVVRERNEDLMEWRFERIQFEGETGVSAVPMGKARRRRGWMAYMQDQKARHEETTSVYGVKPDELDSCANNNKNQVHQMKSDEEKKIEPEDMVANTTDCANHNQHSSKVIDLTDDAQPSTSEQQMSEKPFFKIVGAVDGVRDQIYMDSPAKTKVVRPLINKNNNPALQSELDERGEFSDDDMDQMIAEYRTPCKEKETCSHADDNFDNDDFSDDERNITIRPIIVECKHRMRKAIIPPPLYDQIQTCIYCQMHETEEADLIQVLRNQNTKPELKESAQVNVTKEDIDNSNHIEITISRISINDPIHNHKHHWTVTLLPRLASFVDAVYSIRKDDTKRYRMLIALVAYQDVHATAASEREAWQLLWDECPWLKYCDTAFGRR